MLDILKSIMFYLGTLTFGLIIGGIITYLSKPLRNAAYSKWKRMRGKEKHRVIVTGIVYSNIHKEDGEFFEVIVNQKDLDDSSMDMRESDGLIIDAINNKYGKTYRIDGNPLHDVKVKEETYYL